MTISYVPTSRLQAGGNRRGVTLNEILFAILVMGVGLLSVLSLFPIGLLNVARAVQLSRAGAYADAVLDDLQVRRLLAEGRYRFGPVAPTFNNPSPRLNNPFIADHGLLVDGQNADNFSDIVNQQGFALSGERGLPVAIDPLWLWARSSTATRVVPPVQPAGRLGVFFNGAAVVNSGIQRVMPTNGINDELAPERLIDASDNVAPLDGIADAYPDWLNPATLAFFPGGNELYLPESTAQQIFGSRDDITFRETDPDPTVNEERRWQPLNDATGVPLREQKYTSLVTAYLPDAGDPTRYEASVAVFFNREFPPDVSLLGPQFVPSGERTLLAYYLPQPGTGAGNLTIPVQPSNQVILMWPASQPAPEIPREGWILDASYDANAAQWNDGPPVGAGPGPGRQFWPHRAFWYKIVGRGEPKTVDSAGNAYQLGGQNAVRQLITLDRPVREVTYPRAVPAVPVTYPLPPTDPNFDPVEAGGVLDPVASNAVNVAVLFTGLVGVYERTITVPNP